MRSVALSASRCILDGLRSDVKTVQLFQMSNIADLDRICMMRFFASGASAFGKVPTSDIKFTKRHEWISKKDGRVGVTHYVQDALGDVVYAQAPDVGLEVKRYDVCGALESVKAASEIYAPLDGTIKSVNSEVENNPNLINSSPYDKGWVFSMTLKNPKDLDKLMNEKEYDAFLESEKPT